MQAKHEHEDSNPTENIENDSLSDFKTPEKCKKKRQFKLERPDNMREKAVSKSDLLSNKIKKIKPKKVLYVKKDSSQKSIESSFFKQCDTVHITTEPTDSNTAFACPLCLKMCKDEDSRVLHMKICATKHNISTKQLFEAIELQKKQENERKALGLFVTPVLQERRKGVSYKKASATDADLQLALALSKSMQEVETANEIKNIDEYEILNAGTSKDPKPIVHAQLERFSLFSMKPGTTKKVKKKKLSSITTLETRSNADRNLLLAERIAEILMADDAITQQQQHVQNSIKSAITLQSTFLQELRCLDAILWEMASLSKSHKHFYVENLNEYIPPSEETYHSKYLSAAPIHLSSQKNDNFILPINEKIESGKSSFEEPKTFNGQKRFYDLSHIEKSFPENKFYDVNSAQQFSHEFITDWQRTLNNSAASDILIFSRDQRYIWAHKLVFYVRCPAILMEVVENQDSKFPLIKEKITLPELSYEVALGFLEFIYCGLIEKYKYVLKDEIMLTQMRNAARRYKLHTLFNYMRLHTVITTETKPQDVINERNVISPTIEVQQGQREMRYYKNEKKENASECYLLSEANDDMDRKNHILVDSNESHEEQIIAVSSDDFKSVQLDLNESCTKETRNLIDNTGSPDMFEDCNDFLGISMNKYNETKELKHAKFNTHNLNKEVNKTGITADSSQTFQNMSQSIHIPTKSIEPANTSVFQTSKPSSLQITEEPMVQKQRSNLSLFIEQFRRENAKSDSISDLEITDASDTGSKVKRNPFNVGGTEEFQHRYDLPSQKSGLKALEVPISNSQSNVHVPSPQSSATTECDERGTPSKELIKSISWEDSENAEDISWCTQKCTNLSSSVSGNSNNSSVASMSPIHEDELSVYSKYKLIHEDNSIAKYRPKKKRLNSQVATDNASLDVDLGLNSSRISASKRICLETKVKEMEDLVGFSSDTTIVSDQDVPPSAFDSTGNALPKIGVPKKKLSSLSLNYELESDMEVEALCEKPSTDVIPIQTQVPTSSPVLISSSPDTSDKFESACLATNKKRNLPWRDTDIFENEVYIENVRLDDDIVSEPGSPLASCRLAIPGLSRHQSDEVTNNDLSKIECRKHIFSTSNDAVTDSSLKNEDIAIQQNIRKLRRKSVSHGSIRAHISHSNISQQSQCTCNELIDRKTNIIRIERNVTPPPNYEAMDTPKLHEELKRHGLKLQRRKRAIKLLSYIYNELHPFIPIGKKVNDAVNDKNIERTANKLNLLQHDEKADDCILSDVSSSDDVIPKGTEFNEQYPATILESSIKDSCLQLIKANQELYNRILLYEPLCLESLYLSLKTNGVKCNKTQLMDFLDEQCITFFVEKERNRRKT